MATNTTNYGWTKPDYEDDADIAVLNETFDAIDAQLKTVETALNNKQNALTTAQLAAVNSGVNSTKVAQITTNKNNISLLRTEKANVYGKFVANTTKSYNIDNSNTYLLTVLSYDNWGIFLVFAYDSESTARINAVAKSANFDNYLTVQANGKNAEIVPVSTAVWYISNLIRLGN